MPVADTEVQMLAGHTACRPSYPDGVASFHAILSGDQNLAEVTVD